MAHERGSVAAVRSLIDVPSSRTRLCRKVRSLIDVPSSRTRLCRTVRTLIDFSWPPNAAPPFDVRKGSAVPQPGHFLEAAPHEEMQTNNLLYDTWVLDQRIIPFAAFMRLARRAFRPAVLRLVQCVEIF
jgi:hypothetical protein